LHELLPNEGWGRGVRVWTVELTSSSSLNIGGGGSGGGGPSSSHSGMSDRTLVVIKGGANDVLASVTAVSRDTSIPRLEPRKFIMSSSSCRSRIISEGLALCHTLPNPSFSLCCHRHGIIQLRRGASSWHPTPIRESHSLS
jgi:hypothetical protein